MSTPIALLHDQGLLRAGLVAMLAQRPDYHVLADAATEPELCEALHGRVPQVLVLIMPEPGPQTVHTVRQLLEHLPQAAVLVVSATGCAGLLLHLLCAGAQGFIALDQGVELLCIAMATLAAGGCYFGPDLRKDLRTLDLSDRLAPPGLIESITPREADFLRWLCDQRELGYAAIGRKMDITKQAATKHKDNLCAKLKVKTKAGLMAKAVLWGLDKLWKRGLNKSRTTDN
jgi:DNA-binding NarL/FixJ family response regulator